MIYYHVTAHVQRRKIAESAANYEKHLIPLFKKHGQKLVGAWQTTIGVYDEVTNLYAYENLAEMDRIRRELREDPTWIEYMKTSTALVGYEVSKVMVPFPFSPLK